MYTYKYPHTQYIQSFSLMLVDGLVWGDEGIVGITRACEGRGRSRGSSRAARGEEAGNQEQAGEVSRLMSIFGQLRTWQNNCNFL